VKAALAQPELFSSEPQREVDAILLGADPPAHAAVRRLLTPYFTGAALAGLNAGLRREAEGLLRPRLDLVADYAIPLTRKLAAMLVGLEEGEVAAILAADDLSAPAAAMSESSKDLLRRARIQGAIRAEAGDLLDENAALSLVRLLCRAATETSERLIVRSAAALLDDEGVRCQIEARPALLPRLVDEALRLWPPEPNVVRRATRDVPLGGTIMPAGATLFLSLLAANRDPRHFPDPRELRLDRLRSPHLAFSDGPHQCLGSGLGRRAAVTALEVLLDRSFRSAAGDRADETAVVQGIETPRRLAIAT
jgi:cytochrome P450